MPLQAQENPYLKYEFCAQIDSSKPLDVPLLHIHNLDPAHTIIYLALACLHHQNL